jgi:hypothetical protein
MSAESSQRARDAALTRWAHSDPVAGTEAARAAFLARFERQVDPDGALDPDERERRAKRLRRVAMSNLARKRWARARKRGGGADTTADASPSRETHPVD